MKARAKEKPSRGSEFLGTVATACAKALREVVGMDAEQAEAVADEVCAAVVASHGGGPTYIGIEYLPKIRGIHRRIWAEFNGHNHAELAKRHGYTLVHVYRIIKRMRQEEVGRRQLDAFQEVE